MHFDLSEVTQVTALDSLQFFACLSCPIVSSSLSSLPYLIPPARAKQAKVAEVEEHAPEQSKTQKLLVEHASLLNAFLKPGIQGPHMWPQAWTFLSAFKSVGKPGHSCLPALVPALISVVKG